MIVALATQARVDCMDGGVNLMDGGKTLPDQMIGIGVNGFYLYDAATVAWSSIFMLFPVPKRVWVWSWLLLRGAKHEWFGATV